MQREEGSTASPRDGAPADAEPLAPVIEFLREHAPFDLMERPHLEFLAARLKLGFYPKNVVITAPDRGAAVSLYIVKRGRVRGEVGGEPAPSRYEAWELNAGESFPVGALLGGRPVRTVHRAAEDTFCYELDRADFVRLLALSPAFNDFCVRRLSHLLDQALARVQAVLAGEASVEASLNSPLGSLVRRAPVTCRPSLPLKEVVALMHGNGVGSVVITDEALRPLGIFTLHDLLGRVATAGVPMDVAVERVMTTQPVTLPPDALAHEAAAVMARYGFGHICVVEGERLAGVLSERDLFSLQRISLVALARAIAGAPDVMALRRVGADIQRAVRQMLTQGAQVGALMQIVTLLNDQVGQRAIALCLADSGVRQDDFTWLVFGSEGRQEQTLRTDQDNGILFYADDRSKEARRRQLLAFARRVNQALADIGYPLCPGNVMASNPECCLTPDEWRARFAQWIDQGDPTHLLKASIYFDFRPLAGDGAPAAALRQWVTDRAAGNPRFLRQLAESALRNRPPLNLFGEIETESGEGRARTVNLKQRGTLPFVDGARLLALAHRIGDTNTMGRLRAVARLGIVPSDEVNAWCDAYAFLQLLRLRRHGPAEDDASYDNRVDPLTLNELDQRILKEVFRQARKLQARIALDHRL